MNADKNNPLTVINSFKKHVKKGDLDGIADCFYQSHLMPVRQILFKKLAQDLVEIQECYEHARVVDIRLVGDPKHLFTLSGCPHSRFQSMVMIKLPDGGWVIESLEVPEEYSDVQRKVLAQQHDPAAILPEFHSPEALLSAFKQHVQQWDLDGMATCFRGANMVSRRQTLLEKLDHNKAEIQECYSQAKFARVHDDGNEHYLFTLDGCPHPRFQAGVMYGIPGGSWHFLNLEISEQMRDSYARMLRSRPRPPLPPLVLPSVLTDPSTPPDFSSPQALFATTQRAVEARDLPLLFRCFASSDRGGSFDSFRDEFEPGLEELQLIRAATLGPELVSRPGTRRFSISGWPGKQTVTLVQKDDGNWSILRL